MQYRVVHLSVIRWNRKKNFRTYLKTAIKSSWLDSEQMKGLQFLSGHVPLLPCSRWNRNLEFSFGKILLTDDSDQYQPLEGRSTQESTQFTFHLNVLSSLLLEANWRATPWGVLVSKHRLTLTPRSPLRGYKLDSHLFSVVVLSKAAWFRLNTPSHTL